MIYTPRYTVGWYKKKQIILPLLPSKNGVALFFFANKCCRCIQKANSQEVKVSDSTSESCCNSDNCSKTHLLHMHMLQKVKNSLERYFLIPGGSFQEKQKLVMSPANNKSPITKKRCLKAAFLSVDQTRKLSNLLVDDLSAVEKFMQRK